LVVANNSANTTTCNILGNEKVDSVGAGLTKTIVFNLGNNQPSFYLNLSTIDRSQGSYQNRLIRILNTEGLKHITITAQNQLQYSLTPSEKIIADYKPRLRTKNFWKLDSIISIHANDIAAAEIIYLSLCDIDVHVDTIGKYFHLLTPSVRTSAYGKRIKNI